MPFLNYKYLQGYSENIGFICKFNRENTTNHCNPYHAIYKGYRIKKKLQFDV